MADSVHVGRWLDIAVNDESLDILFMPTSPHRRLHTAIKYRSKAGNSFAIHRLLRWASLPIWILDREHLFDGRIRSWLIKRAIRNFKPDFIHILETQNGGYPFSTAHSSLTQAGLVLPPIMLTLFGSDLFWFKNFPTHLRRIKTLLGQVQIISAECARDLQLAKEFGFTGTALPLVPVAGGLPDHLIGSPDSATTFSHRKTIAVKGYGGQWGLGFIAVNELAKLPEELRDYKIEIFSASRSVAKLAKRKLGKAGIDYRVHKKFTLNHLEILKLYRRSRIYIGLSKSDGLPASMLEAMSQGCYPIQSATACFQGWVEPGVSGTIIQSASNDEVRQAILNALMGEDALLTAQKTNLQTILMKYSSSALRKTGTFSYSTLSNF